LVDADGKLQRSVLLNTLKPRSNEQEAAGQNDPGSPKVAAEGKSDGPLAAAEGKSNGPAVGGLPGKLLLQRQDHKDPRLDAPPSAGAGALQGVGVDAPPDAGVDDLLGAGVDALLDAGVDEVAAEREPGGSSADAEGEPGGPAVEEAPHAQGQVVGLQVHLPLVPQR